MSLTENKKTAYWLGIDIGSVSCKYALLDAEGNIRKLNYQRLKGEPVPTVIHQLEGIFEEISPEQIKSIGVTGSGGDLVGNLLQAHIINEIVAQARATTSLHPNVKTIIEIGGEDSKLIQLDAHGSIHDFSMNTMCAAGTGSFLDQQANRLGVSIEDEFGALAVKSKHPPRIAGRCSVFAKSDMIHLQQIATPDYDIVAGLCHAMARSFKSNLGRGKEFEKPIAFQGGVAANQGMVKAFYNVLELDEGELVIPEHFACMGAIGTAQLLQENSRELILDLADGLLALKDYLAKPRQLAKGADPLTWFEPHFIQTDLLSLENVEQDKKVPAYLGIDVGSISTNVVAIDENRNVLAKCYLMTAGRPLEAVRQGLSEVGAKISRLIEVKGVGTTGSGRYLVGDFVGADTVRNEITAQAKAAINIDKSVDTIFEIGGQDSKYICFENGVVVDFEMNKVCAAGTGSFLEEQAEQLGISIKEEFGDLALSAQSPAPLGERCTVFIESDLHHHQQQGASKENLVAGLSYSIVQNYLNRVVGKRKVGEHIFFQGGVAANQGVVAAFESVTGKKITVPPHHEVTGAIGVAIIAQEKCTGQPTKFKGFDLGKRQYQLESFECDKCSNRCEVKKVLLEGEEPLYYGSRCELYEQRKVKQNKKTLNLFAEREKHLVYDYHAAAANLRSPKARIGIPRSLFFHEFFPFWKAFFNELNMEVILSEKTNKQLIHKSLENLAAETCFPIKVTHGHVLSLLDKDIDYLFLPSVISLDCNMKGEQGNVNCPYVQTIPYTIQAAISFKHSKAKLLQPVIQGCHGSHHLEKCLLDLGKQLGCTPRQIKRAWEYANKAQNAFIERIQKRGKEVLDNLTDEDMPVVILSRPYNGCDDGLNLALPRKLPNLGFIPIPVDFLPLEGAKKVTDWPNMYWRYGRRILRAADYIRENPKLSAIYITNFGCGPDSFIGHFFTKRMAGKPYLQLEVDEHSADAGAITRCEAFRDSLESIRLKGWEPQQEVQGGFQLPKNSPRKLFIPNMSSHCLALAAAFRRHGVQAQVLPKADSESIRWGRRYTSGRECYPCIVTTGDMLKKVHSPGFKPEESAFFMPSGNGPCRFGQYNMFHRLVLDDLGYDQIPIFAPIQNQNFYADLGIIGDDFIPHLWHGVLAVDFLDQLRREIRPYELNAGQTDTVYNTCLEKIQRAIEVDKTWDVMQESKDMLMNVPYKYEKRPVIGVVGEIFVRSNSFCNHNLIREIEALGGEVWLPPVREWFLYLAHVGKQHSKLGRKYSELLSVHMTERFLIKEEHRFAQSFKGIIRNYQEPSIVNTIKDSEPYLHESFEGEAVLSIGKSVDFIGKGVVGIINTMPFTCMPGTIVTAVLKRLRRDFQQIPCLDLVFDGLEQANTKIRLQAFLHQAKQYQSRKNKAKNITDH